MLLAFLLIASVALVFIGTLGMAGLQRWGVVLYLPVFAGLIAALLGPLGIGVMVLTEWIGGAAVRGRYGAADYWAGVLILSYLAALPIVIVGTWGDLVGRPTPPPPPPEPPEGLPPGPGDR